MITETPTRVRVLLVDDHEMVRVGLTQLLTEYPRLEIVGEAGTVAEAIHQAGEVQPDVVIMDIRLPDGEGYQACDPIRAVVPNVRFLVLTSYTDDASVFESIAAGVNGYLLKEVHADELAEAVEQVHHGKSILAPAITDRVLYRIKSDQQDVPEKKILLLSRQERRVLELVAEGNTNKEIGVSLNLSDKTVKNYLSNVMDKLEVNRRTEAAAIFARYSARQDS